MAEFQWWKTQKSQKHRMFSLLLIRIMYHWSSKVKWRSISMFPSNYAFLSQSSLGLQPTSCFSSLPHLQLTKLHLISIPYICSFFVSQSCLLICFNSAYIINTSKFYKFLFKSMILKAFVTKTSTPRTLGLFFSGSNSILEIGKSFFLNPRVVTKGEEIFISQCLLPFSISIFVSAT